MSPSQVLLIAAVYTFLVGALTAAAAGAAFSASPPRTLAAGSVVPSFAVVGIWFAPLAVYVFQNSEWAMPVAVVLACMLGQLLSPVLTAHEQEAHRRMHKSFAAALAIQTGVVAGVIGSNILAAYLLGSGCFLVAWWMTAGGEKRGRSRSLSREAAIGLVGVLVTAAALLPFTGVARSRASMAPKGSEADRKSGADDMYSGIILIPEVQRHVTIVPPVPALRRDVFRQGPAHPLSIPFSGEYWIYYWPLRQPPKNSIIARGTPAGFKFTATGRTPLIMQAKQTFGKLIDVRCCSRIDLAISNTDPLPGTVSVELRVVNTSIQGRPSQSLGEVMIMSALAAIVLDNSPPVQETLRFSIPPSPSIREFDEILVRFHLHEPRKSRSANVAVERFELIPRGG